MILLKLHATRGRYTEDIENVLYIYIFNFYIYIHT